MVRSADTPPDEARRVNDRGADPTSAGHMDASGDDDATLAIKRSNQDRAHSTGKADDAILLEGQQRYRVLRVHARGGLGTVSIAIDESLGREVALKALREDYGHSRQLRARFMLEATVTGRLEHPGIVPIYGLGLHPDGRPFYTMPFIRGQSLQEAIDALAAQAGGSAQVTDEGVERAVSVSTAPVLSRHQLIRRFIGVCEAIGYAHDQGVLHRDLKPSNIMLGPYGETLVVDWGLAKLTHDPDGLEFQADPRTPSLVTPPKFASTGTTQAGLVLGTPAFMSPEQAKGLHEQLGPESDIFSLGATLYAVLTGDAPYSESSAIAIGAADPLRDTPREEAAQGPHDTPPDALARARLGLYPRPRQLDRSIPRPLESICLKALAPEPQDRYRSALGLAADLERWLAGAPVLAHHPSLIERLQRALRRKRALWLVGLAALVASGAVAFVAQQKIRTLAHPPLELQLVDAGLLLLDRHDTAQAAKLFREAAALERSALGELNTDPNGAGIGLALALGASGQRAEALQGLTTILETRRRVLGEDALLTQSARSARAELLMEGGALKEAARLLDRSFSTLQAARFKAPRLYRWALARKHRLAVLQAAQTQADPRPSRAESPRP